MGAVTSPVVGHVSHMEEREREREREVLAFKTINKLKRGVNWQQVAVWRVPYGEHVLDLKVRMAS